MRIIRFIADDGRVLLGEDHLDGTASVLYDAEGVLGLRQQELAQREVLRGKRALVADDDDGIRQAVGAVLAKFECECVPCRDGDEAIRVIGERDLDVVVSDIVMPHRDGYDVFAAARRRSERTAVVLVTGFGYDPNHTVVRACREGCRAVLYKPFTPQQLVQKVFEAVQACANGAAGPLVRSAERLRVRRTLAPLVPAEILCVGRNYMPAGGHGADAPGELELFMKPRGSVQDPDRPIVIPPGEDPDVQGEGELGVVIWRHARGVPESRALDHVLGYVAANDVTARRWQRPQGPASWLRGKGFDTFCPVGPALLTADELGAGEGLEITTAVNGRVLRRGNSSGMLRSVARLVSELSTGITLLPGTLLLTGAPPLLSPRPPPALRPGDEMCVEIERIGKLLSPVEGL
jgi:2-keto-4-pentenoate hydratase/2-oxohepta-3-ene-1,7-dioic acid hydratase in catechol pathway